MCSDAHSITLKNYTLKCLAHLLVHINKRLSTQYVTEINVPVTVFINFCFTVPPGIAESFHSSLYTPNSAGIPSQIIEKMYGTPNISTLTSETSTGTDITTSRNGVTQFKQVSCQDKAVVFANPYLPEKYVNNLGTVTY